MMGSDPICRLAVGLGFQAGVSLEELLAGLAQFQGQLSMVPGTAAVLAVVDKRLDSEALRLLVAESGLTLVPFSAAALAEVRVPHPGARVREALGTPSVAEAAALLAAGYPAAELIVGKTRIQGITGAWMTFAAAQPTTILKSTD